MSDEDLVRAVRPGLTAVGPFMFHVCNIFRLHVQFLICMSYFWFAATFLICMSWNKLEFLHWRNSQNCWNSFGKGSDRHSQINIFFCTRFWPRPLTPNYPPPGLPHTPKFYVVRIYILHNFSWLRLWTDVEQNWCELNFWILQFRYML